MTGDATARDDDVKFCFCVIVAAPMIDDPTVNGTAVTVPTKLTAAALNCGEPTVTPIADNVCF